MLLIGSSGRRKNWSLGLLSLTASGIIGLGFGGTASAAISMDVNDSGVPWVLIPGTGYGVTTLKNNAYHLAMTPDGYLSAYDSSESGYEFHLLSPSLKKLTTDSGDSQYSLTQGWLNTQDLYTGTSVATGTKTTTMSGMVNAGVTRPTDANTNLGWSGGGNVTAGEFQWQLSNGDPGVQQATRSGFTVAPATQLHYNGTSTPVGGDHKADLEYVATSGGKYQMLGANGSGNGGAFLHTAGGSGIRKMLWSENTAPTSNTAGTLTMDIGASARLLVGGPGGTAQSLLDNLVPSVADTVEGMAINPADGALYMVSVSGIANDGDNTTGTDYIVSDNKVYLSAVTFAFGDLTANSTATYLDLDPNSANNYLEITWAKPGQADGVNTSHYGSLLTSGDLAFSADGTQLYVSNQGDRVFMFTVGVPEPTSLAALTLGGALMTLRRRRRA